MRAIAKAIGGYYPTPERVAALVAPYLTAPPGAGDLRVFDPCCGTGRALLDVSRTLSGPRVTVGVELHAERAREAHLVLTRAVHADVFKMRCTHRAFSLLFLNPPYDDDASGSRQEETFLKQTLPYLAPGGVLIYLIPIARLAHPKVCTLLTTWCTDLLVLRFPHPEYEVFKQAVVFGVKKTRGERNAVAAGELARQTMTAPALGNQAVRTYRLPRLTSPWEMASLEIDPVEARATVRTQSPLWHVPEAQYYFTDTDTRDCHPLLPPRKAHVATLAAAGLLNNAVIDGPEGPTVLKGSIRKAFRVDPERSDEGKTVEREQLQITIKVVNRAGVITTLQ
jgi:SAM-dependent methyltransferase